MFFGVPNDGLDIASFIPIVGDGPNRFFIESLGQNNSQVLKVQRRRFYEAFNFEDSSEIYCFYETCESKTAQKDENGKWSMTGETKVLVTMTSATHCRPWEDTQDHVCPIPRDHSNIVRFSANDNDYETVLPILQGMVERAAHCQERRTMRMRQEGKKVQGWAWVGPGESITPEARDRIRPKFSARDQKAKKLLNMLYTCPYSDRKDRNSERVPGTCEWFTKHPLFQNWNQAQSSSLLWVSADPGCGKSVLAKYLVDDVLPKKSERTTCYFFFKDDFPDQKSATSAICAILRQLFRVKQHLLRDWILDKVDTDGDKFTQSFNDLWSTLTTIAAEEDAGEIVCILDALDECWDNDRSLLIQAVGRFYSASTNKSKLKFLLTSRPYDHMRREFWELDNRLPTIHLSGEGEVEVEKISREINLVIKDRVEKVGKKRSLRPDERTFLQEQLTIIPHRTYLWVTLTLDVIESIAGFTKGNVRRSIREIPQTVDDAYNRILDRSPDKEKAKKLLHIVTAAKRPLSVAEMSLAMAIEESHKSFKDVEEELEPEERFRVTLRDLCGLFVVIVDTKIYLIHQTAKEFLVRNDSLASLKDPSRLNAQYSPLKWKHSLQPGDSNKILAERCIWYLTSDFVETGPWVLLDYSVHNWAAHFREANILSKEVIVESARNLCETGSKPYRAWSAIYESNAYGFPISASSLTIASYFGLDAVVKPLLETGKVDVDSKDKYGRTPLSWAAYNGHEAVAKLLLETGK
ncbi:hypothetical protein K469DRAFT_664957, partial [Zopfia rhizophila CBS 207.26]